MSTVQITLAPEIVKYIKDCCTKEHSESYLISVMHKVQDKYGYLSEQHMQEIAELLQCPRRYGQRRGHLLSLLPAQAAGQVHDPYLHGDRLLCKRVPRL